jgi:hypothetical protein
VFLRQIRVFAQVKQGAVHRDKCLGLKSGQHNSQFLTTRMATGVHRGILAARHQLNPEPSKIVQHGEHPLFVSGYRPRRHDQLIPVLKLQFDQSPQGKAPERGGPFPLAATSDEQHLLAGKPGELSRIDKEVTRELQPIERRGHANVSLETSSHEAELSSRLLGDLPQSTKSMNIAGKQPNDDSTFGARDEFFQTPGNVSFRVSALGSLDVRAVAQQKANAPLTQLRETIQVGHCSSWLLGIQIKIPRVENCPGLGEDTQSKCINDRVGHRVPFTDKRSHRKYLPGGDQSDVRCAPFGVFIAFEE